MWYRHPHTPYAHQALGFTGVTATQQNKAWAISPKNREKPGKIKISGNYDPAVIKSCRENLYVSRAAQR